MLRDGGAERRPRGRLHGVSFRFRRLCRRSIPEHVRAAMGVCAAVGPAGPVAAIAASAIAVTGERRMRREGEDRAGTRVSAPVAVWHLEAGAGRLRPPCGGVCVAGCRSVCLVTDSRRCYWCITTVPICSALPAAFGLTGVAHAGQLHNPAFSCQ